MGDRIIPNDGNPVILPLEPQAPLAKAMDLRRTSDFLLDNVRIGNHRTHYDKYRRYVNLNVNTLFTAIVGLYEALLKSQWHHFKRFMDSFPLLGGPNPCLAAARVYVSHWFVDLYCSIREATRVISPLAFNERYFDEVIPYSTEYDAFLTQLNASLRPTHIKLTAEDTLYIPVLATNPNWTNTETTPLNPFAINNFTISHDVFYGILQIMKERRQWKIEKISTHSIGRPCWLFDWHEDTQVCAWFPREGNYNDDDVTIAYIIGGPCTPKLGPRDVDDWQYLPPGTPNLTAAQLNQVNRVSIRRFFGAYEVRTYEQEPHYLSDIICEALDNVGLDATKKRKIKKSTFAASGSGTTALALDSSGTPSETTTITELTLPTFQRLRINDWCYHSRVILNMEWHTRTGALRIICFE